MKQYLITNWKTIFKYVCVLVIVVILWSLIPKCSNNPVITDNSIIKEHITTEKKQADSIDKVIVIHDTIRLKAIHHWHTIRHDSLIPCETKLLIADTVIMVDSSEIASLKASIFIKELIILNQDTVIKNNSIALKKANKQIKRQKAKTKLVAAGLGVLLVISLLR